LTKMDVLDEEETIKICVGYKYGNKLYQTFPADLSAWGEYQAIYEELPGWQRDTSKMRNPKDIPSEALDYIRKLEQLLDVRVEMLSVGPDRGQIVSLV